MTTSSKHPLAPRLQAVLYELIRSMAEIEGYNTEDHGITVSQSYTILAIPTHDTIGMTELSDRMGLAKSTMTRMADQLIKRGLISREPAPEDRRAVLIRLTAIGQTLQAQIEADYSLFFNMVLAEIPAEQQDNTIQALETLMSAVMRTMQIKHGKGN